MKPNVAHFCTVLMALLFLAACSSNTATTTAAPTSNVEAVQTSAVGTFTARLTQAAFSLPSATPTHTPTNTPTPTRSTPLAPGGLGNPGSSCHGLTYVRDVTIPDNTPMFAGQSFTKTWLARNTGNCAWEAGFKFAFTRGDAMGGATRILSKAVSPGTEVELSIEMTAPNKTGSARGYWRMSTVAGQFFGDEVFVLINLSSATTTATGTLTATAPPDTPTNSPIPTDTPLPSDTPRG